MGPLTHQALAQKAVSISGTKIAGTIRARREWLDFIGYWRAGDYAAGVPGLPDIVLADFMFQTLPRCVGVVRRLADAAIEAIACGDQSKASFAAQLASHYLVDAPWIGHRLSPFFKGDKAAARRAHDHVENRTDGIADRLLSTEFKSNGYGCWTNFWKTLHKADSKAAELASGYQDDALLNSIVQGNMLDCLDIYLGLLRYLDMRVSTNLPPEFIANVKTLMTRPEATVYACPESSCMEGAMTIAFSLGARHRRRATSFLASSFDEADIALVESKSGHGISLRGGKMVVEARPEDVGALTDVLLEATGAGFGTELSDGYAATWPGTYFLGWSGCEIRERILTKPFYDDFMEATKASRFKDEDELDRPDAAAPEARPGIISFNRERKAFLEGFASATEGWERHGKT